jgi:hypothetical protein
MGVHERTVWRDWQQRSKWMRDLEKYNEDGAVAYLRMSLELFMTRESLRMIIEDSNNDFAKIKACKETADIIFKEFEHAKNIGYFDYYNKLGTLWSLIKEYAGTDMKDIIEKYQEDSDENNKAI